MNMSARVMSNAVLGSFGHFPIKLQLRILFDSFVRRFAVRHVSFDASNETRRTSNDLKIFATLTSMITSTLTQTSHHQSSQKLYKKQTQLHQEAMTTSSTK